MSLPEEYQNVLVYRKDGTPVIAHRNGSRWYGYTLLEWLDFEPDVWTHLEQIDALRAQLAHKEAVIAAQKEVIGAVDKTASRAVIMVGQMIDGIERAGLQIDGIDSDIAKLIQRTDDAKTARAKLTEVEAQQ